MKTFIKPILAICAYLIMTACGFIGRLSTATPTQVFTDTIAPTNTSTSTELPTKTPTDEPTQIPTLTPTFAWAELNSNKPTQTPYPPTGDFDEYLPQSLISIISKYEDNTDMISNFAILYDLFPAAATVEYSGLLRPIDPKREVLLYFYGDSTKNQEFIALFKHELLVREGELEFWMPIQEQLIPYLEEELIAGQLMTVYVRQLGIVRTDNGLDFVFLLNDFHR